MREFHRFHSQLTSSILHIISFGIGKGTFIFLVHFFFAVAFFTLMFFHFIFSLCSFAYFFVHFVEHISAFFTDLLSYPKCKQKEVDFFTLLNEGVGDEGFCKHIEISIYFPRSSKQRSPSIFISYYPGNKKK